MRAHFAKAVIYKVLCDHGIGAMLQPSVVMQSWWWWWWRWL